MKFSGKIEDGTSNEPLHFGSDPWPWWRFVLSESTLLAKVCTLRVQGCLIDLFKYCIRFTYSFKRSVNLYPK